LPCLHLSGRPTRPHAQDDVETPRTSAPRDGARHPRHAVTRAARTRSSRPNRDMSSTVKGHLDQAHRLEERGALRLTHWLGVSQARVRASYFRKLRDLIGVGLVSGFRRRVSPRTSTSPLSQGGDAQPVVSGGKRLPCAPIGNWLQPAATVLAAAVALRSAGAEVQARGSSSAAIALASPVLRTRR
jgi:hypothetical protein